ncbi:MAG: hypothetical protein PHC88_15735 [Terrimicrobiaceae bacterium]|nr:hypothetical protein [Terrimicrobiaceae bacterium]
MNTASLRNWISVALLAGLASSSLVFSADENLFVANVHDVLFYKNPRTSVFSAMQYQLHGKISNVHPTKKGFGFSLTGKVKMVVTGGSVFLRTAGRSNAIEWQVFDLSVHVDEWRQEPQWAGNLLLFKEAVDKAKRLAQNEVEMSAAIKSPTFKFDDQGGLFLISGEQIAFKGD